MVAAPKNLFPNISVVLQLMLTVLDGSCCCGHSYSSMRRLKTWQRSSMGETRYNGLALISIHKFDPYKLLHRGFVPTEATQLLVWWDSMRLTDDAVSWLKTTATTALVKWTCGTCRWRKHACGWIPESNVRSLLSHEVCSRAWRSLHNRNFNKHQLIHSMGMWSCCPRLNTVGNNCQWVLVAMRGVDGVRKEYKTADIFHCEWNWLNSWERNQMKLHQWTIRSTRSGEYLSKLEIFE